MASQISGWNAAEGVAHGAGAKQEDAGVPEEIAGGEIGLRGLEVGLFDEARHVADAVLVAADLDVAIAGLGLGRA